MSEKCFGILCRFVVFGVAYVHAESADEAAEMAGKTRLRDVELEPGTAELETVVSVHEESSE